MPAVSFPVADGETPFTDQQWRYLMGAEAGVVGDVDGSAFAYSTPAGGNELVLGSPTQPSVAVVGGFGLLIPAGESAAIEVPPETNAGGRTDIVSVRFNPAATLTAPCELYRTAGTVGSPSRPSVDEGPPGLEHLALYAVTRKGNGTSAQGIDQAAVVPLFHRIGPNILVPNGREMPENVPLGSRARRDGVEWIRDMVSGTPAWVKEGGWRPDVVANSTIVQTNAAGQASVPYGVKFASPPIFTPTIGDDASGPGLAGAVVTVRDPDPGSRSTTSCVVQVRGGTGTPVANVTVRIDWIAVGRLE